MSDKEILEGNRLIAEFMGGEYRTDLPFKYCSSGWINRIANSARHIAKDYDFKYHKSFDWLMPVVEKIYKKYKWDTFHYNPAMCHFYLSDRVKICTGSFSNHKGTDGNMEYEYIKCAGKEAVFVAVITFINWYNEKK